MRNHNARNQRLLDRVCYLSRPLSEDTDLYGNKIMVKNTIVYNPESKTAPGTARRWADTSTYDHTTRQYVKNGEPEFLERTNDPFSITIIDLDVRSEGGRAYKVIDSQDRCFDLREDQVLEVFKHSGVHAGGQVPGQFVWGILGSQMRMVLVGGDLYAEMLKQAEDLKNAKRDQALGRTPTESTLKVGRIYRKRDKSLHLFLGRVKAPTTTLQKDTHTFTTTEGKAMYAFVVLPTCPDAVDLDDIANRQDEWAKHAREENTIVENWSNMSWVERCQWDWYDSKEYMQRMYKDAEPGYYYAPEPIVLMSSPKFEEELSDVEEEFAAQLRANDALVHKYFNGNREDLAETRWRYLFNNGRERDWYAYNRYGQRDQKAQSAINKAYMETREQFKNDLVWL